jgi:PRC-barrel domain protein
MLLSTRDLESFTIGASDGDIGSVRDVYLDDRSWTIRYLVVDTGNWLPGRRVLISPMSVREASWSAQRLVVGLTKAQVENSPEVDTAGPISRQYEDQLVRHYGLDPYWFGPYRWGAVPDPFGAAPADLGPTVREPEGVGALRREGLENVGPPHVEERHLREELAGGASLRSAREVIGSYIQAADDEIGHVEDFLVDTHTWAIRYMVVDTANWLPGKKVVIAPEWIEMVSWPDSKVHVGMTRAQIANAPEYDPARPIEREQELRLYEHYGRRKYWEDDTDRAA